MNKFFRTADGVVYESFSNAPMSAADQRISKAEFQTTQRNEAIVTLRELLPKGTTVYTILRSASASGMTRRISVAIGRPDGSIRNLDFLAARALGWSLSNKGGLVIKGAGMDMGFHLVYSLSASLYGYEDRGDYALRHEWL